MPTAQELAASAWTYFQAGAMDSAEQLFREAVAADPQLADGWVFLGVISKARGDLFVCQSDANKLSNLPLPLSKNR